MKVSLLCKIIIINLWLIISTVRWMIINNEIIIPIALIGRIWWWLHLTGLKIEVTAWHLVKSSGNIIKRKSIILLKNIYLIQIIYLYDFLPALIRLHSPGGIITVIGMNGRQAAVIKRKIDLKTKYIK